MGDQVTSGFSVAWLACISKYLKTSPFFHGKTNLGSLRGVTASPSDGADGHCVGLETKEGKKYKREARGEGRR